jgi:5'-3' exonuclease
MNNKPTIVTESTDVPNSTLSGALIGHYNEKYSTLSENEKETLKTLINSTDEEKKNLLKKSVKECIDLLNQRLDTEDLELKGKLLKTKEKLLNEDFEVTTDLEKRIIKINDLHKILSN